MAIACGSTLGLARERHFGFTLVELLVAVAVMGILLVLALPSFNVIIAKSRVRGAAEQLRSDINLARTESIKRNTTVFVSFEGSGSTWCYGLSLNDDCDCTKTSGSEVCFLDRDASNNPVLRVVKSIDYRGVTMSNEPFDGELSFGPIRPTVVAGSASFSASTGHTVQVQASGVGRVTLCSPGGAQNVSAYPTC